MIQVLVVSDGESKSFATIRVFSHAGATRRSRQAKPIVIVEALLLSVEWPPSATAYGWCRENCAL